MAKETILNRKNQKVVVLVEVAENPKGLAFVMHGLSGFKEQPHIEAMAEASKEAGYSVVRFDTTNTFGESDGRYEDATVTSSYEDLEDVIRWAGTQPWYREPFVLAGHSLGGMCTALFTESYPEKVKALAPISAVVSGRLSMEAKPKEEIEAWQKTGWHISESQSRPGVIRRLPWSHMEDRLCYDLLPLAVRLTMPVLLIVGEHDASIPPAHQEIFYRAIPGPKELHVMKGAPHTFHTPEELAELKRLFSAWLEHW